MYRERPRSIPTVPARGRTSGASLIEDLDLLREYQIPASFRPASPTVRKPQSEEKPAIHYTRVRQCGHLFLAIPPPTLGEVEDAFSHWLDTPYV